LSQGQRTHSLDRDIKPRENTVRKEIRCYVCGALGHKSYQCVQGQRQGHSNNNKKFNQAAACQIVTSSMDDSNDVNQERFVRLPGNEEILPVVAAVVSRVRDDDDLNLGLKQALIGDAWCNNIPCRYMRDTGSTISICRDVYVEPDQYTGRR